MSILDKSKVGDSVQINLELSKDRLTKETIDAINVSSLGKISDFRITDGKGIGVVLQLSNGKEQWFFEDEIDLLDENGNVIKKNNLEKTLLHHDVDGDFFILPAHSYGLGVALEKMKVPENITVICIGKSTYARLGIIVNTTPAEAGWEGHLTLEFSNSSGADCRIYAEEGICQLLFFEGDPCSTTYEDRRGKYQNQPEKVTLAKI